MKILKIAIDGPSGVGKSTIAKFLSKKYNLTYINTGKMYRAIGFFFLNNKINFELLTSNQISLFLEQMHLEINENDEIFLNQKKVNSFLYNDEVALIASKVAKNKIVRTYCNKIQKELAVKFNQIVMEGRDIGTIIMPFANLKFFLNASNLERAKRRIKQIEEKKQNISEEEKKQIFENINKRDLEDITRTIDPLIKAQDAIEIDTSNLSLDEVIEIICKYIEKLERNQNE